MIKRVKLIVLILAVTFFIFGCATQIPVQVLKPAEVNIGQVKKIAVLDFEFVGNWDFGREKKKGPKDLEELATQVLAERLGTAEKEPTPPDPYTAYPGKEISAKFIAKLVDNGHFTVIEREQISKIIAEQQLSLSGVVDETQAAEIGKILGVEALIIGTGKYNVKDVGEWKEYTQKDKKGNVKKYKKFRITRNVDVQLTYRVVNASTGLVIASKTNQSANYDRGGFFEIYQDYTEEDDEKSARRTIPDWRPIVDKLVNKILDKSVVQIAPHYVLERRELEGGKTPAMKVALDYAKRNLWQDAKDSWETVLQDKSEDGIKDYVPTTYNLGIYYEINGDLDRAEQLFNEAYKKSGKTKYLDARARIQARKEEIKRLEQQGR
jgi:curli biogenesis system outer membrane secretion channel CsgG